MPMERPMGRAIYTKEVQDRPTIWRNDASYLDRGRAEPSRRLVARGELPHRGADLSAGESAAARAAAAGAHQAAAARALGHVARPVAPVRAPEPVDPQAQRRRNLPRRAGTRRAGADRQRLARGDLEPALSGGPARRRGHAAAISPVRPASMPRWRRRWMPATTGSARFSSVPAPAPPGARVGR